MKLRKKVICILTSCLLIFSVCGCQQNDEVLREQSSYTQEEIVDLEALEYEYTSIINLLNEVINTILNTEEMTISNVTSLIRYVTDNRIEPTQKLTIELNDLMDEFMTVGINYYTASEGERKQELEQQMIEIFTQLEEKITEIEVLLYGTENL